MSYAYTTNVFKVFHHVQTSPFFVGYKLGDSATSLPEMQRHWCSCRKCNRWKGGLKESWHCPNVSDMLLESFRHAVGILRASCGLYHAFKEPDTQRKNIIIWLTHRHQSPGCFKVIISGQKGAVDNCQPPLCKNAIIRKKKIYTTKYNKPIDPLHHDSLTRPWTNSKHKGCAGPRLENSHWPGGLL